MREIAKRRAEEEGERRGEERERGAGMGEKRKEEPKRNRAEPECARACMRAWACGRSDKRGANGARSAGTLRDRRSRRRRGSGERFISAPTCRSTLPPSESLLRAYYYYYCNYYYNTTDCCCCCCRRSFILLSSPVRCSSCFRGAGAFRFIRVFYANFLFFNSGSVIRTFSREIR